MSGETESEVEGGNCFGREPPSPLGPFLARTHLELGTRHSSKLSMYFLKVCKNPWNVRANKQKK